MRAPDLFVPAFTTLSPAMLVGRRRRPLAFPFDSPRIAYFYFARNALAKLVRLLDIEGGEILVPAYHHGVEVEALVDGGARVAFYRIGARLETDLGDIESRIGPRTRAIHLTHFLGFPAPVREARAIADRHGLFLIEDCAHALLTADPGRALGRTGHVTLFCLYKGLPLPNGGALRINDPAIADLPSPPPPPLAGTLAAIAVSILRRLALAGGAPGRALRRGALGAARALPRRARPDFVRTGSERFDPRHRELGMSRIALRIALAHDLASARERQRRNFFLLRDALGDLAPPLLPDPPEGVAPFFYPLLVDDSREAAAKLQRRGVEAVDFWRASHPACDLAGFPEVARLRRSVLEIPCHADLDPPRLARCAAIVREELGGPPPAGS